MFVVPAVAAFAAAGGTVAGVAAALSGAAGFATFATVAGGFMASAGMLTGSKTLTKVGSILGLAGVATNIASSLADSASSAWSGVGDAAGTEAGIAESAAGSDAAQFGKYAQQPLGEGLGQTGAAGQSAAELAGSSAAGGTPLTLDTQSANLMDQYRAGMVDGSDYGLMARNAGQGGGLTESLQDSALAQAGAQIKDATALDTILGKLKGAGQWVKDNKEVALFGGQLVSGGMQAYQQGQQFDTQMNLLAQRRARLNNPVTLGIQSPQLKTFTPGG